MDKSKNKLSVSGIDVQIVRKDIKNLHLAVYPPNGRVRVAVPVHVTDDNVRLAVISKLSWIKQQQRDFNNQARQSKRLFISGECHYVFGRAFHFELVENIGKHKIKHYQSGKLKMFVRKNTSIENKQKLMDAWYRSELKIKIIELIEKWQPRIGKKVEDFSIRKMKTKWGSCNPLTKAIILNSELAKKPTKCLEYIFVHEMIHLHERHHNQRFKELLEKHLPNWQLLKKQLNNSPLAHEEWSY